MVDTCYAEEHPLICTIGSDKWYKPLVSVDLEHEKLRIGQGEVEA